MSTVIKHSVAAAALLTCLTLQADLPSKIVNKTQEQTANTTKTLQEVVNSAAKATVVKSFGEPTDEEKQREAMDLSEPSHGSYNSAKTMVMDTKLFSNYCTYLAQSSYIDDPAKTYPSRIVYNFACAGGQYLTAPVTFLSDDKYNRLKYSVKINNEISYDATPPTKASDATLNFIDKSASSCLNGRSVLALEQTGPTSLNAHCYSIPTCQKINLKGETIYAGFITASGNKYCFSK